MARPTKDTTLKQVNVRLSEATIKKLKEEGKKNNEKLSEVVRKKLE
jgi:uncharacterized protein (DUF4415 family)